MVFTPEDLLALGDEVVAAWRSGIDEDWSAPAGALTWSCAKTADHAVDTTFAPAIFLASRRLDDYPQYGLSTLGDKAPPGRYVEAIATAARVLYAVTRVAKPHVQAVIWRRPRVETRGPEDFPARGALELILHAHDVCAGLGVPFAPTDALCRRLRQHTHLWPMWASAGWSVPSMQGDPWHDLLRASGRAAS